jgi:type IX secretion system PorP/SprF family membrane protein
MQLPDEYGSGGISLMNYELGYFKKFNFRICYANHKQVTQKLIVSAGAAVGLNTSSLDGTKLIYTHDSDPDAVYTLEKSSTPGIDIGIRITDNKFTTGISVTQINNSDANDFGITPRHIYLYGDYKYNLMPKLSVVPSLVFRKSSYISNFDFSTHAIVNSKIMAGASYRRNESIVILLGYNINQIAKINYAFDLNMGPISSFNSGSHEIMISVVLNKENQFYYKTPRLFN